MNFDNFADVFLGGNSKFVRLNGSWVIPNVDLLEADGLADSALLLSGNEPHVIASGFEGQQ